MQRRSLDMEEEEEEEEFKKKNNKDFKLQRA
jgi:hypothetical protein